MTPRAPPVPSAVVLAVTFTAFAAHALAGEAGFVAALQRVAPVVLVAAGAGYVAGRYLSPEWSPQRAPPGIGVGVLAVLVLFTLPVLGFTVLVLALPPMIPAYHAGRGHPHASDHAFLAAVLAITAAVGLRPAEWEAAPQWILPAAATAVALACREWWDLVQLARMAASDESPLPDGARAPVPDPRAVTRGALARAFLVLLAGVGVAVGVGLFRDGFTLASDPRVVAGLALAVFLSAVAGLVRVLARAPPQAGDASASESPEP